jgi:hypothetical protein
MSGPPRLPMPARLEYTPEAVAACEKALRTLVAKIGPWGNKIVLIGGLVPRYLVTTVPAAIAAHVGTTDLDVVLGIALAIEEEEAYRTLQKNLIAADFRPSRDEETGHETSFRWQRNDVDGVRVIIEFFCPVGDGEPGRLRRNPTAGVGHRVSAIRLRGAELVAQDHIEVAIPGEVLDQGGRRYDIRVRVANVLPFVVLKALALREREKDKDAYDLVWTLTAFPGGPDGVARAASCSPVLHAPLVREAITTLGELFATFEHVGPSRCARFVLGVTEDDESRDRLRRDAHGAVQRFLLAWVEAGLP